MATKVDSRTGLEVLDRDECWALVGRSAIGRVGVTVDGRPLVFPINFVLDGNAVVFRTSAGTKLWAARRAPIVFECDAIDARYHTGWSVMLAGRAEEIRNPLERSRLARLPLTPWTVGEKPVWLRLRPRTISGRRIPAHGAEAVTS